MRVCFYQDTLSSQAKKRRIIDAFAEGIRKSGDVFEEYTNIHSYSPSDFVLILGAIPVFVGEKEELHAFRVGTDMKKVTRNILVKRQLENKKHTIVIESTLLGTKYYRVGIDHHLPNLADFMYTDEPPDRWSYLKESQKIRITPWRTNGTHILICLQRDGSFAVRDIDQMKWLHKTVKKIRSVTERPIVIRGKKEISSEWQPKIKELILNYKNVLCSNPENDLLKDIEGCWAAVVLTSTIDIELVLNGIPVFTNNERSFTYGLGNNDISNIESPILGSNRNSLFYKLAYSQWNISEMRSGIIWKRIKNFYGK